MCEAASAYSSLIARCADLICDHCRFVTRKAVKTAIITIANSVKLIRLVRRSAR